MVIHSKEVSNHFAYQEEAWQHIINGKSGLVNAPTGTGKTFSVFLGSLIQFINQHPANFRSKIKKWIAINLDHSTTCTGKRYWQGHGRSDR